jgi:hypothetical protein
MSARILILVAVMALCAGCGSNDKLLREEELSRIAEWLPGTYDNRAQVDEDLARNAAEIHEPLRLVIIPVSAPIIGEQIYYAESSDAMNTQRVTDQRLYSFEKTTDDKAIAHTIYRFKEPDRWLGGTQREDIFKSVVRDDLNAASGCELKWEFKDDQFVGQSSKTSCKSAPQAGLSRRVEIRYELGADTLGLAERFFNSKGEVVEGRKEDPMFRFRKVGD